MVLERGEVADSWRRERWHSLRLLTPNWQSRLPGYRYEGADPHGYMTMGEVIDFISRFAVLSGAPVRTHTTVTSVKRADQGYHVATNQGDLSCRTVMLASGACNAPSVPSLLQGVPASIQCLTPFDYRNPTHLPEGGVLIVGASATGVQLADEIHRSGRPVTLSVGEHVRLPRIYRGRDVLWWMYASGVWDLRNGEIRSIVWATGFRPDYSWLHVPVIDDKGYLRHDGGVVAAPGLYALGLPVLRRRKSSFIYGAEDDARELVDHLAAYLERKS